VRAAQPQDALALPAPDHHRPPGHRPRQAPRRAAPRYLLTTSDPRCRPKTSRSATSSCSRPSAPSATSRARCCSDRSSTARTSASARTC
jgi:hypothetical protein